MAKLGFLGLGLMGYPMARNLLRAGHQVALWSNTADKARRLAAEEKGQFCETPQQVAENGDCTFLCVGSTEMSREVILGTNGIIHGARRGTVVADASTISPSASREIGRALNIRGVEFLDAPCTGSTPGAEGGTLTFMIGGSEATFERVKPFFDPMGKRLYYCGGPGLGLQAKLSQNLILASLLGAFNEGMVLATKGGVDVGHPRELRCQKWPDQLQGAVRLPSRFSTKLLRKVDAQGHPAYAGIGKRAVGAAVFDLSDKPDVSDSRLGRPWRRRYLLYNQGLRGNVGS